MILGENFLVLAIVANFVTFILLIELMILSWRQLQNDAQLQRSIQLHLDCRMSFAKKYLLLIALNQKWRWKKI